MLVVVCCGVVPLLGGGDGGVVRCVGGWCVAVPLLGVCIFNHKWVNILEGLHAITSAMR